MMTEAQRFNLFAVHDAVARAVPDHEAVVRGDRRLTHGQLAERCRRLASVLHGRGMGLRRERDGLAGHESGQDHLGLYLYNGNEYVEGMLGAFGARVAPFNVNYRYVADELRYLLRDAGTRGLVYHACFAPVLADVLPGLDGVDVLLQVDDGSGHNLLPGAVDYEAALAAADPAGPPVVTGPDDLYVLYTGGTTGMPKGVLWRQHDIFVASMGGRAPGSGEVVGGYRELADRAAQGSAFRALVPPPLMHAAAQWISFTVLNSGGTVVFPNDTRRVNPRDVWATVARERTIALAVVGDAMARPLVDDLRADRRDVSPLVSVVSGGAPLNPVLKEQLTELVPNLIVADAVGSSETGTQMSHVSTAGSVSSGRFVPGAGTVVLDEERSRVVEPGHQGIGWLAQHGNVPLGYLGDAAKTAETFPVVDGTRYAVPRDRARLLADGQVELLGRDSVTINTGGEKVFAEEVERAIGSHPAVFDVVVVGRPSEQWGQEVVALVQMAADTTVDADTLLAHAGTTLARYKLPKEVVFLPWIQRSPSGKADYRWAKAQAKAAGTP